MLFGSFLYYYDSPININKSRTFSVCVFRVKVRKRGMRHSDDRILLIQFYLGLEKAAQSEKCLLLNGMKIFQFF